MPKNLKKLAPAFIVTAALLWAVDGVLRRHIYTLPPLTIVFFEHLIGSALIAPFWLPHFLKAKITKRQWLALLWIAAISGLLSTLAFTTALTKIQFAPFSVVLLLQKLQPIFAIIAAWFLLGERVSKKFVIWAAVAITAAFFVTFPAGQINLDPASPLFQAGLLSVLAAIGWGSSTAVSRWTLQSHHPTTVTGLRFFLTTLLTLPLLLTFPANFAFPTASNLLTLTAIALSTGLVALFIYYQGLKHTQAKISTILELVFPAAAILIDPFLYQTTLAPSQYLATAVLLFAVYQTAKLNKTT